MIQAQALGFVLSQSPVRQRHLTARRTRLATATHPDASALVAAWRSATRDGDGLGGMVLGRHFPTRRWAKWLKHTVLLQRVKGDFRVRLAGFGVFCFHGFDPTGMLLSEVLRAGEYLTRAAELDEVLSRNRPHVAQHSLHWGGDTVMSREVVSLPVLAADTRTRLVLSVSFWTERGWLN
ncbi:MAG: hypothetical protein JOZ72_04390 [Alphaproteobacteria bacterium]|nr:hypothetical protein [Alphaproteobacteria bacterium]